MDKNRSIVKNILTEYNYFLNTYTYLNSKLIISEEGNKYLIIIYGYHNNEQIHEIIVEIIIFNENDCVRVTYENKNILRKLLNAGIENIYNPGFPENIDIYSIINLEKVYKLHKSIFTPESNIKNFIIKGNATVEELRELSIVEYPVISKQTIEHPNIPPDLLVMLFPKYPLEVFDRYSSCPLLKKEPLFLEKLYDIYPRVFHQEEFKVPSFFIEWAIDCELEKVRVDIASSKIIADSFFKKLLNDSSCAVIQNLYNNHNLPLSTIEKEKLKERKLQLQKTCQYKSDRNNNCSKYFCRMSPHFIPF